MPRLGRSPGEGNGYPLQYSGLENPMDSPRDHRVGHDWVPFTSTSIPLSPANNPTTSHRPPFILHPKARLSLWKCKYNATFLLSSFKGCKQQALQTDTVLGKKKKERESIKDPSGCNWSHQFSLTHCYSSPGCIFTVFNLWPSSSKLSAFPCASPSAWNTLWTDRTSFSYLLQKALYKPPETTSSSSPVP